jgi:peptidyl-prolyl cis-trans isomerase B (cyclophilin B)
MRLIVVLLAVLALGGCVSRTASEGSPGSTTEGSPEETTESSESSETDEVPTGDIESCRFVETPGEEAPVGLPPEEPVAASRVELETSVGELTIELAADVPCTVHSFVHLAGEGFFDETRCHRLTTAATLKVVQCGDPKSNGTGGPGYTIPDEPPTTLEPVPGDTSGQGLVLYPRGTVAMAKAAAPNSGGSQFFLVYGDSTIPPQYTVFGMLDEAALTALDTVAAAGVAPGASAEDGPPVEPVVIESASVS